MNGIDDGRHTFGSGKPSLWFILLVLVSACRADESTPWIELGTLGGEHSGGSAINDLGEVVGASETEDGEIHAFLWRPESGMVDLGTFGVGSARGEDVNDLGQVVGCVTLPWPSDEEDWEQHELERAFVWNAETGMQELGSLGGEASCALAINNAGHAVGWSITESGHVHAFQWTVETGMTDLGTLTGTGSQALAINDFGDIVGIIRFGSGERPLGADSFHVFIRPADGEMRDLGTFRGWQIFYTNAVDINNVGHIAGNAYTQAAFEFLFVWTAQEGVTARVSVDAAMFGGSSTNDLDEVVNSKLTLERTRPEMHDLAGIIWQPGFGVGYLGLEGALWSSAEDINNRSQVVGTVETPEGHRRAVIWELAPGPSVITLDAARLSSTIIYRTEEHKLNERLAAGLLAKVRAASAHVGRGDCQASSRMLDVFEMLVNAYVQRGMVVQDVGEELMQAAEAVRIETATYCQEVDAVLR